MAEFLIALPLIIRWESMIWSNVEGDLGGETYCGISRVEWCHLHIWKLIDSVKSDINQFNPYNTNHAQALSDLLIKNTDVQDKVVDFYRSWWNRMSLSELQSQKLANYVFQFAINCGEISVAKKLQMACVTNGALPRTAVDGCIGPQTIRSANSVPPDDLIEDLAIMQRYHYIITRFSRYGQNKFRRGWEARVKAFL